MVSIRPATQMDIADIVRIHIDSWKAQFTSFLTIQQTALKDLNMVNQLEIWQERFANEEGKTRYTFVATTNQVVVGYITGILIDDEYDTELHQIYVLPSVQGRGIGKELVQYLAKCFHDLGKQSLLVWVMTINPAVKFYRDALGGKLVSERIIPNGDGILKETAYVWSNLLDLF